VDEQGSNGIVIGIVSRLDDDANLGRVKVKFPHLDYKESDWVRLATLMAGPGRGTVFLPEVDDEVLVGFEHGDPRRPYVLGCLWSAKDKPPPTTGQTKKNNQRLIQSRSGQLLVFDDTAGKEKVEVVASDGKQRVVVDSAANKVRVLADAGDVEVTATDGTVKVFAKNVQITARDDLLLEAGGRLTIRGQTVDLNP
jgi:uncharacterized protein involved in type VI secretion and phage assembly